MRRTIFDKNKIKLFFKRLLGNKLLLIGSIIVLTMILLAVVTPYFLKYDAYEMVVEDKLSPPSSEHLFGTDDFGRDLFARSIYGAQVSIYVGVSVALITSVLGLIIGLVSSYYKIMDHILMRISDGLLAIPGILLAISLMAAFGATTNNVIIALSIVFTPQIARIVRSKALSVREELFVEAARSKGASSLRIMFLHIAPNTLSVLIVQATFIFADSIITEAALSFLGAGVPMPDPSWGNILQDGKLVLTSAWWMTVFPGFMIILTVIGLNFFGDGLRDAIDPNVKPKPKKRRVSILNFKRRENL